MRIVELVQRWIEEYAPELSEEARSELFVIAEDADARADDFLGLDNF